MCYLQIFSVFSCASVHGKFQDLVNAQPYQTQLDQQLAVYIAELCCCSINYSTSVVQE